MMTVRLAREEDAEAISQLIGELSERYIAHEFSDEGRRNLLSSMSTALTRSRIQSGYRYHVYEEAHLLVGVAATRDNSHLYHLFVAQSEHRRGVARALWTVAQAACLEAGGSGTFTVNSSRFAASVYERFGFVRNAPEVEKDGVIFIPMFLGDGNRKVDAVQPRR